METLAEKGSFLASKPDKTSIPHGQTLQENGVGISSSKNDGMDGHGGFSASIVQGNGSSENKENPSSDAIERGRSSDEDRENGENPVAEVMEVTVLASVVTKMEEPSVVQGNGSSEQIQLWGVMENNIVKKKENPSSKSKEKGRSSDENQENGENLGAEVMEVPVSVPEVTKNGTTEEEEEEEDVGKGEEDKEEEEEMDDDAEEHEFKVGDFVWGKIKSHPWWPGQIYDPSDASKYAAKYQRRDRLLVAYFGDGTFAWCYPSQLKPFQENFEQMASQSNSKSFLNAVEEAVDEIGRRVQLEMTCSCAPEEIRSGLARPLAVNAGIKEGVAVPDGGIGELSITQYEPAKFLERLRYFSQVVSMSSMLELTVFRSQISAFYCAKGFMQLPMYHQLEGITDPEIKSKNEITTKSDFNGKIGDLALIPAEEVPLSSLMSLEIGKIKKHPFQKGPEISEDKLPQKRKQRSMAELLAKEMDVEHENNGSHGAKEGTVLGKPASTSRKEKKNKDTEVRNGRKSASLSKTQKKTNLSESPAMAENKSSGVKNDGGRIGGAELGSSLRDRKKSKYLSPPYTIPNQGYKAPISSKDSEKTESLKVPEVSSLPRTTRAASKLTRSPSILKGSSETIHKKPSKKQDIGHKASAGLSPSTPKENQNKTILKESIASPDKMLSEFRSAALDPLYLKENKSSDSIKDFFSSFRSSLYRDGSHNDTHVKQVAAEGGRKRKSSDIKPASLEIHPQETDQSSSKDKSERKKRKQKEETSWSRKSKLESAAGKSNVKINHTQNNGEAEGGETLVNPSALQPHFGEEHPLQLISQNLEMVNSKLEKSWNKLLPEVKSHIEGEITGLLNKVSTMVE